MPKTDKRIDEYIAKAQPFAQPILKHIRSLVHEACPQVEETVKWGMPSFDYKGPYFSMAAFKHHAVFGFWKAQLLRDPKGHLGKRSADGGAAMGHGGQIKSLQDLPPDKVLIDFLLQAKKLNDDGVKLPPKAAPKEKKKLAVPDYFIQALAKKTSVLQAFEGLSPSHKREYVEWLTEAKTEATRDKRLASAVEWIGEGKSRNWKYERK